MLKAEKLNVFIESVISFFAQIGDKLEDIDTPYLNSNQSPVSSDYTGIITITGPLHGCVYVSASSTMLRTILHVMDEPDNSLSLIKDLVGEIANTVSGNARSEFGSEFIISPPKVIDGSPNSTYLPQDKRTYVIPFRWRGSTGVIGICVS